MEPYASLTAALHTHVIVHQVTQEPTVRPITSARMLYVRTEERPHQKATPDRAHVNHAIQALSVNPVIFHPITVIYFL